jgi:serine/threonine-protein kinase
VGTIVGPAGYTFCANEYETCSFPAGSQVAFGSNGSYNYKTFVTNSVPCTTGNFGDPLPAQNKACFYKAGTPTPTPTPTIITGSTLFPSNSWFYRDVSQYPLDAENTLVTTALNRVNWGFGALRIDFSIDVLTANASTPFVTYVPNSEAYVPDCDRVPMPLPVGGNIEGESGYQCTSDGDCHMLVIDPVHKRLYEMYRAGAPASQSSLSNFYGGCQVVWDTTKAISADSSSRGEMCTSADAAGYPIVPLLVNADELYDAVYNNKPINHALRFILPNDRIRYGWYLHPATHTPGPALSGDVDMPPYGTLLRLRADYPVQNLATPAARAVAKAMQTYGMYLADGGNIALTFQSDQHTTHKWSELNFDSRSMVGITPGDFQMVDGGSRHKDLQQCTRTMITSLP